MRVYTRERFTEGLPGSEYKYLANLDVGDVIETVAIPDLPDLLEFMRQTVPLATTIDTWSMKRHAVNARFSPKTKQPGIVLMAGLFCGLSTELFRVSVDKKSPPSGGLVLSFAPAN